MFTHVSTHAIVSLLFDLFPCPFALAHSWVHSVHSLVPQFICSFCICLLNYQSNRLRVYSCIWTTSKSTPSAHEMEQQNRGYVSQVTSRFNLVYCLFSCFEEFSSVASIQWFHPCCSGQRISHVYDPKRASKYVCFVAKAESQVLRWLCRMYREALLRFEGKAMPQTSD